MGERKVQNKYYPPDFDPSKIKRPKKTTVAQFTVRMMMPMTVQCTTCGEYIYAGKKFNGKKETVVGEDYLGIRVFRFYMKCPQCSSQFTIKTDPQNADYKAEWGCTRNFEPWKNAAAVTAELKAAAAQEVADETADAMKLLEKRTKQSLRENNVLEGLDEIRALNARNAKLSVDDILAAQRRQLTAEAIGARQGEDADAVARAAFAKAREALLRGEGLDNSGDNSHDGSDDDGGGGDDDDNDDEDDDAGARLRAKNVPHEEDVEDDEMERFQKLVAAKKRTRDDLVALDAKKSTAAAAPPPPPSGAVVVQVKRKGSVAASAPPPVASKPLVGAFALLGQYAGDDSD
jgi:hypothetical protein